MDVQNEAAGLLARMQGHTPLIVSVSVALVVAMLGGALTDVGPWYENLRKASLNPPNWAFAVAGTLIFGLCVAAAVIGWGAAETPRAKTLLVALFLVNAALNVGWSALFFASHRPDLALPEVIALWLSVLSLVVFLFTISKVASALVVPYLLWVSFAFYLNYAIVRLNPSFGG